jgi:curli biogenesis system outer membrane secretion channel CsgG
MTGSVLAALVLALALPAAAQGLPAVVVWDFDNQTPAGRERWDYLRRVLPESLNAALLASPGLQVVERQRLKDVLAEQKLASGELADEDTRLRLGRIAGAGRMVFGGFFALGDVIQVNLRVVDTATSRVLFADEISASAETVLQQAEGVNRRLAHTLGGADSKPARDYPRAVWQAYDAALALSDSGRYEEAIAALQVLLAQNNQFTPAERQLVALLDKTRRR